MGEKVSSQDLSQYTEINHRRWGESGAETEGWCDLNFHFFLSILFVLLHNAQRESQGEGEESKQHKNRKVRQSLLMSGF